MRITILMLAGLLLVAGCESSTVPTGDLIDCPAEIGEYCASVYEPVCGEDGETYSNSCVACQTVSKYVEGECGA